MAEIKLLISDFDGTLVNTFEANYLAYKEAFSFAGITLQLDDYKSCFGLRFDAFMNSIGVTDNMIKETIRRVKGEVYPNYFSYLKVNKPLLEMLYSFKKQGGMTAIASTARRKNLMNALSYIGAIDAFSYILAGEDVINGKPNPEIYNKVLSYFNVHPNEALVFEDSNVGFNAAISAGISFIRVNCNE